MRRRQFFAQLTLLGILLLGIGGPSMTLAQEDPVIKQVYDLVDSLSISQTAREQLKLCLGLGFSQQRITPDLIISLLTRVKASVPAANQQEELLTATIMPLCQEGVPIILLINSVHEGLTKNAPVTSIIKQVRDQKQTLLEVQGALALIGFQLGGTIQVGSPQAIRVTVPLRDAATTEVSSGLESYVRKGGKTDNADGIKAEVRARLQINPMVSSLTDYILTKIPDLTWIMLAKNVERRIKTSGSE